LNWRLAKSLDVLRSQVNDRWPNRKKENDGTIGDAAHSARSSDHNPNGAGVVCALDITNDPATGPDAGFLAETLRQSRDPRIKYLISNKRICSSQVQPWVWRPYSGINDHTHHVHISVGPEAAKYDSIVPWTIERTTATQQPTEAKMQATGGTNAFVWGNWLGAIITALTQFITPDLLTNLLGNKFAWLVPFVTFLINAIGHGTTGNSSTSVLPGITAPMPAVNPPSTV